MPKLNVRLAAIILVSLLVVGGGVHFLHAFQVARHASYLKTVSEQAEKDDNLAEAIRRLRDYIVLVRLDPAAEIHLGELYIKAGQLKPASDVLEDAIRKADKSKPPIEPEKIVKARRTLIEDVAMRIGLWSLAKDHLEILLDGVIDRNRQHRQNRERPEGDAKLLTLYARILVFERKEREASVILRDAMVIAPDHLDAYQTLAVVLVQDKKDAEADDVIELMSAKNAKSMDACEACVQYYLTRGKFDKAFVKAELAQKIEPNNPRGPLLAGQCYMAKGDYAKAEEFLRKGIKGTKNDGEKARAYRMLSEALVKLNKPKEMIDSLRQGLEATKGTAAGRELLWDMANAQIASGDIQEAGQNVKKLRDEGYPPAPVDFLDAQIAIRQQDWPKAKRLLKESVIPGTFNRPVIRCSAYYFLAQCLRQEGVEAEQREALESALKIDSHNLAVRSMLADIYMSRRKPELAAEQFRQAALGPQRFEASVGWLRVMIGICKQREESKRDWTAVNRMLDALLLEKPGRPDLVVLKAEVLLHQGKEEQAADLLRLCTAKEPKAVDAWLALVRLAEQRASKESDPSQRASLWKEATDILDQAGKSLGDRVIVRLERGRLAVARKDPRLVDVLKNLSENTAAMSAAEKMQLLNIQAVLSDEANETELCQAFYRQLALAESKDIRARVRLCELQLRAFEKNRPVDAQELDRLAADIERLVGQGPYWRYAKAIKALVQSKNKDPQLLAEAREHLAEAMKARNDWPPLAVLTGKICELLDDRDQALEHYKRAIFNLGERDSDVIGRAARLLVARRQLKEANELFLFLERQKSSLLEEMPREHGLVKVFLGDVAEAEKLVEKLVAADSKNAKDFLWQGEMYAVLTSRLKATVQADAARGKQAIDNADKAAAAADGKFDDKTSEQWKGEVESAKQNLREHNAATLRMAQRSVDSLFGAKKLNPQDDAVWIALVQLMVDINQAAEAKPYIEEAHRTLTSDKALATIGRCWELLNEPQKAEESYRKALKAFPDNTAVLRQVAVFHFRAKKPAEAVPLLRKIIALQTPAALSDACWARSSLALVLKGRNDFESLSEAARLIDENLTTRLASLSDLRMKVDLLLADPRKEKLNEAIATMEKLVAVAGATSDDHFALAQLYLRKRDKVNYEEQMHAVLGSERVQPWHYVSYINALMDRKEFEDADRWLKKLETVAPQQYGTVQSRAEYLYRRGQYADAADLAMNFVRQLDPKSEDRGQQILFAAQLLENFAERLKSQNQQAAAARFAADAETLFKALTSKKVAVNGIYVYADFLARQKRVGESLSLLERSWNKDDANELLVPAISIIKSRATTPAECDQLEKLLAATAQVNRSPGALLVLSGLHEKRRHYDKAVETYREILDKDPRNFKAMNNLAVDLARSGQKLDEALKLVNQALAICGPLSDILDSRALVYIARQEYDKALDDLTAAVRDDGSAEQLFHQAWVLSLMDRTSDAAAAFKSAQDKGLDPKALNASELPVYDRLKNSL